MGVEKRLKQVVVCSTLALIASGALSQEPFPSKPLKIVVGSEPGSAPDLLARDVAQELRALLKQPVIVENRPGAAGTIAAATVAAAAPDGYTMLMGTVSNIALAGSFYKISYDANTSFTPIGMVASVPLVLAVNPSLGARNYAELQRVLRQPGSADRWSYSSPGVGGPQHLAGVLLTREIGVPMLHVPYKSGGAAATAIAAGDVQLGFLGIPAATALMQGKRLDAIFVTAPKRSPAMPDVPSAPEAGLPAFDIDNWHALFAPAKLPPDVRSRLESALQAALKSKAVHDHFLKLGAEAAPGTGAALAEKVAAETARWSKVVADNKLKSGE